MVDQMKDMVQQLLIQFANRDDVNRRFAQMSKKIKELLEMIGTLNGPHNEDDAMFSKKPLGPPAACASCEKNLVNMLGLPVDYHTWKRMPARDNKDRIARYGQGFSKILQNMRHGELTVPSPDRSQSKNHR